MSPVCFGLVARSFQLWSRSSPPNSTKEGEKGEPCDGKHRKANCENCTSNLMAFGENFALFLLCSNSHCPILIENCLSFHTSFQALFSLPVSFSFLFLTVSNFFHIFIEPSSVSSHFFSLFFRLSPFLDLTSVNRLANFFFHLRKFLNNRL